MLQLIYNLAPLELELHINYNETEDEQQLSITVSAFAEVPLTEASNDPAVAAAAL